MKRLLTVLVALSLIMTACLFVGETAVAEEFATVSSSNGYGVRMRSGPGTSYAVIAKYPVGTTVTVLQHGTAWSQIQTGTTTGWMNNSFLIFGTIGSGSSSSGVTGICNGTVYSPNGLRVWLRATANGKRLSLYSAGTSLTVLEKGSKWCKVYISGSIGYMMTEFIDMGGTIVTDYKLTGVSVNYDYPAVGDVLTASVTPSEATASFEWIVDGETYSTSSEMTVLERFAGLPITVKATGYGSYTGTVVWVTENVQSDPWIQSVQLSNANPVVGDVLSAVIQPSSADVIYSWRVNGTEVSNEATYTVTENDTGKLIQLKVTGQKNFNGSASATAASEVTSGLKMVSVDISTDEPKPGDILTAEVVPASANVVYTWTADGMEASNSSSYQVKAEDLGKVIKVVAKGVTPYSGEVSDSTGRVKTSYLTDISISTANPCAGRTITATVLPAGATVDYQWYLDDVEISGATDAELYVDASWVDGKISVSATGKGVYGGTITSGYTNVVTVNPVIKSVSLSNFVPILGDTITAIVSFSPDATEAERIAYQSGLTYLWYVDNEKQAEASDSYTVKDSDYYKHIRVRVIGVGDVTGSATSAYTDRVKTNKALTGVTMYIGPSSDGVLANRRNPEVGETLYACVSPDSASDTVVFNWYRGNTLLATGDHYTIAAADKGANIWVRATPNTGSNYTGEVTFTSMAVVQKTPMTFDFNLSAPVKGITPQYSATAVETTNSTVVATASVRWLDASGEPALLDEFGTFLPSTEYTAELTVTLASGYTLIGAAPKAGGVAPSSMSGNVILYKMPVTGGNMPITDLYINAIGRPAVGEEAITSFSMGQYDASVTWTRGVTDGIFELTEDYAATISITPKTGYDCTALPDNAFTVDGADYCDYIAGDTKIYIAYDIDRTLAVVPDATSVEMNGSKDQLIICYATLTGVQGALDTTVADSIEWKVLGDITSNKTSINENGLLYIAGDETVGKSLTVKCIAEVDGKTYTATQDIKLISGSSTGTISVVFETVHNSIIAGGASLKFKAHAINSDKGVTYYVESDSNTSKLSHTSINSTTGELTVGVDEQAETVVVIAKSVEGDKDAYAKWEVVVVHSEIATKTLKSISLENDGKKTFSFGKSLSSMNFPKAILTYSDSTTETVDVNWDYTSVSPDYDPSKTAGSTFSIAGTVILPGDVLNPDQISTSAIADITVLGKEKLYLKSFNNPSWSVSALKNGITVSELISNLPQRVACELNTKSDFSGESSTGMLEIIWDSSSITPAYDETSTEKSVLTVFGDVDMSAYENPDGLTTQVSLVVTVEAKGLETKVLSIDTSAISKSMSYTSSITDETIIAQLDKEREVSYKMGDNTLTAMFPVQWSCVNSYDDSIPTEQIINVVGYVQLSGIDNPDAVSAEIVASVSVGAQPAKLELGYSSYQFPDCDLHHADAYSATVALTVRNVGGQPALISGITGGTVIEAETALVGATLKAYEGATILLSVNNTQIKELGTVSQDISITFGEKVYSLTASLNVTATPCTVSATVVPSAVTAGTHDVNIHYIINDPYNDFIANGGTVNGVAVTELEGDITRTGEFVVGESKTYTVEIKEGTVLFTTNFTDSATVTVEVIEEEPITE